MSAFSADWLGLREPYDARARNRAVLDALAAALADRASIAVVDLACGTGATSRAIASRLPRRQSWRLVDNDPSLLARAASPAPPAGTDVVTMPLDLARQLDAALAAPLDLVTASALLDLVSGAWLERLARAVAARGLMVYAALSYDGRLALEPADPVDAAMIEAVNRHQRGDKGFGPALGPTAAVEAVACFAGLNYAVASGTSDWRLGPADQAIQADLVAGWATAARQLGGLAPAEIDGWLDRRRDHVARGRSSIEVGHVDVLARPIGAR
ncbi:MAG: class I SAM-dependent methyltransferase [Roseiarcus sp.]